MSRDPFRDPRDLIDRVYAYAAYRLGEGADAEDVTSDTFERALRYRDTFDPRRGEPVAWLIGIARRRIADVRVRRELPLDDVSELPVDADEEQTLRRLDLHAALERLGERDRELVALRYGADLTSQQVATLLEMKRNAVDVALHRALARLRTLIEEDANPASSAASPFGGTAAPLQKAIAVPADRRQA